MLTATYTNGFVRALLSWAMRPAYLEQEQWHLANFHIATLDM